MNSGPRNHSKNKPSPSNRRHPSPHQNHNSGDSAGAGNCRMTNGRALSFTRSRSPAVTRSSGNAKPAVRTQRTMSPSVFSRYKPPPPIMVFQNFLPATFQLYIRFPFTSLTWTTCIDTRNGGECVLLLGSLLYATIQLSGCAADMSQPENNLSLSIGSLHITSISSSHIFHHPIPELYSLIIASFAYIVWAHSSFYSHTATSTPISSSPTPSSPHQFHYPPSPRNPEALERDISRRSSTIPMAAKKNDFGFIWMSVPKNYRYVLIHFHSPSVICTVFPSVYL